MSASLIRRGLQLLDEKDGVTSKQKKSGSLKRNRKRPGAPERNTTTLKHKHIRSALDEYKKKQKNSRFGTNLQFFLSSANKTRSKHAVKIVKKTSSRRACHQPDQPDKKPEEKSVFTEEEFQKFQKEYFSNL